MGGGFGGDPFMNLHREMNRLFDDAFRGNTGQMPSGGMLMPHMDVSETEGGVKICAELPGVNEQDIYFRLEDDLLVVRAEKKFERKDEKENYRFRERSYGTFQRALRLPGPVEPDQVQARFENGVLTVTVPKTEQQERSRRIQIQGGSRTGEAREQPAEGGSKSEGQPS